MDTDALITRREVRTFCEGAAPVLREAPEGGGASRTIDGYAVVFGVESVLMVDWCDAFREVIEPGAVTDELLLGWDVKMLLWHNREKLLARWNKGEGTLRLSVDETGVKYSFEAPHTPDGETALELVRRGDLAGSSFAYWADERSGVTYEKRDDGTLLRRVTHVGAMYDTSIVSDPAYQQTSVTAREAAVVASAEDVRRAREAAVERERLVLSTLAARRRRLLWK